MIIFFFNDTATTEIYTLSLHDALPICPPGRPPRRASGGSRRSAWRPGSAWRRRQPGGRRDRKSTRLNSSHANISYAVFCLKKKKSDDCLLFFHSFVWILDLNIIDIVRL